MIINLLASEKQKPKLFLRQKNDFNFIIRKKAKNVCLMFHVKCFRCCFDFVGHMCLYVLAKKPILDGDFFLYKQKIEINLN